MLKRIFICSFLLLAKNAWAQEPLLHQKLQKISHETEYVAADYGGAVDTQGHVIDTAEYEEQLVLIQNAIEVAKTLDVPVTKGKSLLENLQNMLAAIQAKQSSAEIQNKCRLVRQNLMELGVRWEPPAGLLREKAQQQFQALCASCHGTTGRADTSLAATLRPQPISFYNAERMDQISPLMAYHTITFGISNTAMPSFDQLSSQERWNLALYVVGLRHQKAAEELQTVDLANVRAKAQPLGSVADVAQKSDSVLQAEWKAMALSVENQNKLLAYLRVYAPYEPSGSVSLLLRPFQEEMKQVLEIARQKKGNEAREAAISAYLDRFEPYEAVLRTQDNPRVQEVERLMTQKLYRLLEEKQLSLPEIEQTVQQLAQTVEGFKEQTVEGSKKNQSAVTNTSYGMLFASVFWITLREGLETALLVAFLVAFLKKTGNNQDTYIVHIGWLSALGAGLLTYFITHKLFHQTISGRRSEQIELISTLLTLLLLVPMTHLVVGQREAKHWLGFLGRRLHQVTASGDLHNLWRALALWLLAFLATYREMLETILMYRAALVDHAKLTGASSLTGGWPFLLGIGIGCCVLLGIVWSIVRAEKRLNLRPVLWVTSVALGLFCIVLTGHVVQKAHLLGYLHATSLFSAKGAIPWLGVYGDVEGLAAQVGMAVVVFGPSVLRMVRKRTL